MKNELENRGIMEVEVGDDESQLKSAFDRLAVVIDGLVKDIFTYEFSHDFCKMSVFIGHVYLPKTSLTIFISKSSAQTPYDQYLGWFNQKWYVMSESGMFAEVDAIFKSCDSRVFLNDFRLYKVLRPQTKNMPRKSLRKDIVDFIGEIVESC